MLNTDRFWNFMASIIGSSTARHFQIQEIVVGETKLMTQLCRLDGQSRVSFEPVRDIAFASSARQACKYTSTHSRVFIHSLVMALGVCIHLAKKNHFSLSCIYIFLSTLLKT